jgi:threonine/homoserine/homoserine lactone efflux protein
MWANVKFWLAKDIAATISAVTFCVSLVALAVVGFFLWLGWEEIKTHLRRKNESRKSREERK